MSLSDPRFSDDAIKSAIDSALAGLEPGKSVAVLAHADEDGASLHVYGKIADEWKWEGYVGRTWAGETTAGANVIWSK